VAELKLRAVRDGIPPAFEPPLRHLVDTGHLAPFAV